MKGQCVAFDGEDYAFRFHSSNCPTVGKAYNLEPYSEGTAEQNRAIHALIGEFWKSGLHPTLGGEPYDTLRNWIKKDLGTGMEKFFYGYFEGDNMQKGECKTWDEIPVKCRELYKDDKAFIVGKLKSMSKYTKKQRMDLIDRLIDNMIACGVNSKKFQEIIEGLNSES